MKSKNNSFLRSGTEVVTDDLRIGFVEQMYSADRVMIRFHTPPWPFPEIDIKKRCQLHEIPIEYEEAPF